MLVILPRNIKGIWRGITGTETPDCLLGEDDDGSMGRELLREGFQGRAGRDAG